MNAFLVRFAWVEIAGSVAFLAYVCWALSRRNLRDRWTRWRRRAAQERQQKRLMEFHRTEMEAMQRENDRRMRNRSRPSP